MRKKLTTENVEFLIVHASNTNCNQDLSLKDIAKHRATEGYPDIGFHWVISRDGFTRQGINISEAGTHTPRFDAISIGILLVGGKTTRGKPSDNFTQAQKASLVALFDLLTTRFPNASIVGVSDIVGGTNPNFNVRELYESSIKSPKASEGKQKDNIS